jgi:hypothetical protein
MNPQLDAFDHVHFARTRTGDASSSHEAADLMERTGKAKQQAEQVLAALKKLTNATSMELARYSGIDRYVVARRLPELHDAGLVTRHEPGEQTVPCEISGKRVLRWRAV